VALGSRSKESVAPDYSDCVPPSGAYSDWASTARNRHLARKPRGLAVIIPPVKITRTHAGKRFNQVLENEAE
jgi:hypothetical protein